MKKLITPILILFALSIHTVEVFSNDYYPFESPVLNVIYAPPLNESIDESYMIIEDWMKDIYHWETALDTESNQQYMELENWMFDVDHWIAGSSILDKCQSFSSEDLLELENWMKNPCHWNNPLKATCNFKKIPSLKST